MGLEVDQNANWYGATIRQIAYVPSFRDEDDFDVFVGTDRGVFLLGVHPSAQAYGELYHVSSDPTALLGAQIQHIHAVPGVSTPIDRSRDAAHQTQTFLHVCVMTTQGSVIFRWYVERPDKAKFEPAVAIHAPAESAAPPKPSDMMAWPLYEKDYWPAKLSLSEHVDRMDAVIGILRRRLKKALLAGARSEDRIAELESANAHLNRQLWAARAPNTDLELRVEEAEQATKWAQRRRVQAEEDLQRHLAHTPSPAQAQALEAREARARIEEICAEQDPCLRLGLIELLFAESEKGTNP